MCLSGSKTVSTWFSTEPISVREHLLAGLIDSDGHVVRSDNFDYVDDDIDAAVDSTLHEDFKTEQAKYERVILVSVYQTIVTDVLALALSWYQVLSVAQ
jgi:hypothetical protein